MKTFILSLCCVFFTTISFSQLSLIETHQNPSCFGSCNGIIAVTPNNMVGAVSYTWLPSGPNNSINSNLCAGSYTVFAEDAASNTAFLTVTLMNPTPLNATTTQTNMTCPGWCNGIGSVTPFDGTPPYNYTWQNGATTQQATNLCAGVTTATITDLNGCAITKTVSIIPSPQTSITTTVTNASCGLCNGSATTTVIGGVGPYMYQWFFNTSPGSTTFAAQNLCPGSGSLIVTDANGCVTGTFVTIGLNANSIPNTTITSTSYNETCYFSGDGSIDVTITGPNPGPFTYTWSNGATTQDLTNISSNNYQVIVYDANSNCATLNDTIHAIGSNCGTISGNVYADMNSDCIKNAGDVNFTNAFIVINPGNRSGYTNPNGDYIINNLPYGTYSISSTNIMATCTQTISATVNAGTPVSVNNDLSVSNTFTLQPDITVWGYSNGIVPGFPCSMTYFLNNLNMNNASGLFKATLPPAFIPNIISASPAVYTLSGDTIIWNFSNITYGNQQQFSVSFTVPVSTALGSPFNSCGFAQPNVMDVNPANNAYCYQRTVTGSYDPNDKTVSPVGNGPNGDIPFNTTDLTYLIRFQNTGNGPAVNIVVKDTVSPNVDLSTFEMLSASHNYSIDILDGNVLRWKFNNIMLADSGSNEPASHGYIQYRIKRSPVYNPGQQIKNTAYIYFDFNEPIMTNTALNTIELVTGIKNAAANENEWSMYPNPSNGTLYLSNQYALKEQSQVTVVNSIGQTVYEETINGNHKILDLGKLNNGVYFVKVNSDTKSTVKRIVLNK